MKLEILAYNVGTILGGSLSLNISKSGEITQGPTELNIPRGGPETETHDLSDTRSLLGATLEELKLRMPSDVFEKIEKDDFVEIYNSDLVSIYKSVNFWDITSYSLDEIYSFPYDELFGRDRFSETAIFQSAKKIFSGEKSYIENPAPSHFAWELRGPIVIKIEYKLFSALYDQEGTIVGGASISRIKMLDVDSNEFLANRHQYSL